MLIRIRGSHKAEIEEKEQKLKVNNNLAELERNSIRQQNIYITDTYGPYLGKEYLDTDRSSWNCQGLSRLEQRLILLRLLKWIKTERESQKKIRKRIENPIIQGDNMYRVVIADDEVLIRMYIREILENNGYEVVGEAEDGLDAIAVCRQKKPDFVIMDINMPVMTGLEATKVINEDKLAGFVIILTAYRDKEITDQAVNTDVMGYIVKPVDEDTLIPSVKIAIHNYNQRERLCEEFTRHRKFLDDRKYLDRSKGLVMERKKMSEKRSIYSISEVCPWIRDFHD